jgi:hypothetical protein
VVVAEVVVLISLILLNCVFQMWKLDSTRQSLHLKSHYFLPRYSLLQNLTRVMSRHLKMNFFSCHLREEMLNFDLNWERMNHWLIGCESLRVVLLKGFIYQYFNGISEITENITHLDVHLPFQISFAFLSLVPFQATVRASFDADMLTADLPILDP